MSISVFPGAVNADLGGVTGTFFQRAQKIVGACICFLISGGDLEALTEDILDKEPRMGELRNRAETRMERSAERHFDNRFVQPVQPAGAAPRPGHPVPPGYPAQHSYHNPLEPTRVYHRAITPLFAGAAPEAGGLGGRVSASRLQNCPTYRLTGNYIYSISPPGRASHFQVGRRSVPDLRLRYGSGVKQGSRNT